MMEKPLPILLHIPYTEKFSLDSKDYYGSLYDYLKTFDIVMSESKEYVEALSATPELQAVLDVPENTPILKESGWFQEQMDNTKKSATVTILAINTVITLKFNGRKCRIR